MNISQISNKESNFNIDNLTNYLIFTCDKNRTINLTNETSFILEGQTNLELTEDINLTLSFNNTNDFHMKCVICVNDSSLFCLFDESNLKVDNYINVFNIKENEINTNNKNIFLIGLNKIEFIYEKEIKKEEIKTGGIKLYIILIIIIVSVIILSTIIIITNFIIRNRKKVKALELKNASDKNMENSISYNKNGINGSSRENC